MRIFIRDSIIVGIIFLIWIIVFICASNSGNLPLLEAVKAFPGHLLITIGYYAVCNVCYSILFISDCVNEYKELIDELEEGKKYFMSKGIKYN
jgi:hypothetical protein